MKHADDDNEWSYVLGLNTRLKAALFLSYMMTWAALWTAGRATQLKGATPYSILDLTLVVAVIKLIVSAVSYLALEGGLSHLASAAWKSWIVLLQLFAVALVYAVANYLQFVNLRDFEPGFLVVIYAVQLPMTGLAFQLIFCVMLDRWKWIATLLLTLSAFLTTYDMLTRGAEAVPVGGFAVAMLYVLAQLLCSVLAAISNEYILKGRSLGCWRETPSGEHEQISTNLVNGLLYLMETCLVLTYLLASGKATQELSASNFRTLFTTPLIVLTVVLQSSVGLIVGFFLRHLDAVRKSVAAALDIVTVNILSAIVFHTSFGLLKGVAVGLALIGALLYQGPEVAARLFGRCSATLPSWCLIFIVGKRDVEEMDAESKESEPLWTEAQR